MSDIPNAQEKPAKNGIFFRRLFTAAGSSPLDSVKWIRRDAVLIGSDGKEKFRQNNVEVPEWWSDTQINVVADKYFRKIGNITDGYTKETSAKQIFTRVANWLMDRGLEQNIFATPGNANNFRDELLYMFANGMFAFNSPVWFNVGVIPDPQCSACFLISVADDMKSIMELSKTEVMLFKGGSGTGTNLTSLRSSYEKLAIGGHSSGPVSFMEGFDAWAGATKSGGATRRAAKMVILDVSHPDILVQRDGKAGFITCKAAAEEMAHDLYDTGKYSAEWNIPNNIYEKVGFQNANNSVRVSDEFMQAVLQDGTWSTKKVKTGEVVHEYKARDLWDAIVKAAWFCGDPGVQFDTTINDWNTSRASGWIRATNPCSEFVYLDDTACNLSSLNLMRFASGKNGFMVDEFVHACEIATTAMEIIVDASSYPTEKIAQRSHEFRPLGLGYTNLGGLLTYWGLPYNSNEARSVAGAITALMCGSAYRMSADLAKSLGPFPGYEKNQHHMLRVIQMHWDAAKRIPAPLHQEWRPIVDKAYESWRDAYEVGRQHGFRNGQVTAIAPTGTISFLMGADCTGIEPMLGCVVYKKVVGEGMLVLPNNVITPALRNLGYSEDDISFIVSHIRTTGDVHGAPNFDDIRHGPIFSQALGKYAIPPEAHVDMVSAVQPFVSGSISKTVNMPKEATIQDIADIYLRAWKAGLKCVAIYRDGCKLSQPIGTELTDASKGKRKLDWGQRKKIGAERQSITHKFEISGHEGYITAGMYEDGTLAEVFMKMAKEGSTLNGLLDSLGISLSLGLQYGVPLTTLTDKYKDMKFEPSGFTPNEDIRTAKSIVDYIFRWLEKKFIHAESKEKEEGKKAAVLDGPPCHRCGNMTRRVGNCYCCTQCGATTGCG